MLSQEEQDLIRVWNTEDPAHFFNPGQIRRIAMIIAYENPTGEEAQKLLTETYQLTDEQAFLVWSAAKLYQEDYHADY